MTPTLHSVAMCNDLAQSPPDTAADLQSTPKPLASSYRFLTESEKRAIVAERAAGMLVRDIAARYRIDPATVWRTCQKVQQDTNTPALSTSWRSEARQKAVRSVNRALDDDSDVYKSGNIGVQVLKGLGDFAPDSQQVNVTAMLSSAPPAGIDLDAPIDVTPTLPPSKDSE